jgi:hypothetical protein
VVLPATVHRHGAPVPFGVPWLDEPGTDPAVVRFSRGGGLPESLPDVLGIALRIDPDGRPGDALFATTGRGPVGRFLLRPRRAGTLASATYSTLQPYRAPSGPVVLAATPEPGPDATVIHLAAARPTGRWVEFGAITVDRTAHPADADVSFDPFLNPLPGLANYAWARRLREGAYAAARRSRRRSDRDVRVTDLRRG